MLDTSMEKQTRPRNFRRDRLLLGFSAAALLLSCGYLGWSWKIWLNPGMRSYEQGMEYASAKHYNLAERAWQTGAANDPANWQCREKLGDLYTELRRFPEAAAQYTAAAKISPNNGDLFLGLERAQAASGNYNEAYDAAKQASALLPSSADAVGEFGLLAVRTHHDTEAIRALRQALALKPTSTDYLLALVAVETDNQNAAQAERDLAPFIATHSDNARANYYMALILNQKPRTPENIRLGLHYATLALPGMTHSPQIYHLLGLYLLAAGRTKDAYQTFLIGYQIAPHSPEMLHGLLECDARLGDEKESSLIATRLDQEETRNNEIEHLKHVLGFNHKDIGATLRLAQLEEAGGRQQDAVSLLAQALQQTPGDKQLHSALSALLIRIGRPDLAKLSLKPNVIP